MKGCMIADQRPDQTARPRVFGNSSLKCVLTYEFLRKLNFWVGFTTRMKKKPRCYYLIWLSRGKKFLLFKEISEKKE